MCKERYRALLVFALTIVCTLMYFAYNNRFARIDTNQSVLAEESAALEVSGTSQGSAVEQTGVEAGDGQHENESVNDVHMVIPCGTPIGIYVKTQGVMVIDTSTITASDGKNCSPCAGLLEQGDYIVSINGIAVEDKNDLIALVEESGGESLQIGVVRDEADITVTVKPVQNDDNRYMLGLWVKDDISGIGTLTYVDENGFGALGHSINDNDTGVAFNISDGAIYDANLVNVVKPSGKNPGRLEGMIDYSSEHIIGRVETNSSYGIQGYITKHGTESLTQAEWIPVARKDEAHLGDAYLLSAVSGKPEYYQIEITGIDISNAEGGKGLEIQVTDPDLLAITNGIVQGMSGTPIIQDGKLLGAVTHVFLKDATKGYGTFIESMMYESD